MEPLSSATKFGRPDSPVVPPSVVRQPESPLVLSQGGRSDSPAVASEGSRSSSPAVLSQGGRSDSPVVEGFVRQMTDVYEVGGSFPANVESIKAKVNPGVDEKYIVE